MGLQLSARHMRVFLDLVHPLIGPPPYGDPLDALAPD